MGFNRVFRVSGFSGFRVSVFFGFRCLSGLGCFRVYGFSGLGLFELKTFRVEIFRV